VQPRSLVAAALQLALEERYAVLLAFYEALQHLYLRIIFRFVYRLVQPWSRGVYVDVEAPVLALLVLDGAPPDALVDGIARHPEGLSRLRHGKTFYGHVFRHVLYSP